MKYKLSNPPGSNGDYVRFEIWGRFNLDCGQRVKMAGAWYRIIISEYFGESGKTVGLAKVDSEQ